MMQRLIQQFSVRAGTLLARRRLQISIASARFGARRSGGCLAVDRSGTSANERIKMFDGLLQEVSRKLLAKIREIDCVDSELSNLMKVCGIPAIFVDEKLIVR